MALHLRPFMLLSALVVSSGLLAGDGDHDRAREALEAGEILPLRTIIEKLDRDYPRQILEVELDHEDYPCQLCCHRCSCLGR